MRRTALTRKTALQRGSAELQRRPLLRRTPLHVRSTAPARPRDTGPDRSTRDAVKDRAQGHCERCGTNVTRTPGHIHHRKPRQAGGTRDPQINAPENLLCLCTGCHEHVERHRARAYEQGFLVRRGFDPAAVPVLVHGVGLAYPVDDGWCPAA